ncbi:MAG TPA: aspartate 1-decarboxylase [Desulfobacterales bacterium]|nr:aspartate 1-decarboxylase [Desulfobacterales bacterium]
MMRQMLKSKLHRATVTHAELHYEGSLTVDRDLMDAVDLVAGERVQVYNINNGERFDTYVIEGERGSGVIGLNGAAARKGVVGDRIIVVSYAIYGEEELASYRPLAVLLDERNRIVREL